MSLPDLKRRFSALVMLALLCLGLSSPVQANAAALPHLTILVLHPPQDLQLSLAYTHAGKSVIVPLTRTLRGCEARYDFYYPYDADEHFLQDAQLQIDSAEGSTRLPFDLKPVQGFYWGLVTLNLEDQSFSYGAPPWRAPLFIASRLFLTLLLEGALFYAFGYRQRRSWLIFLALNLFTQGFLNIYLSLATPSGYLMLAFLCLEGLIFFIEAIVLMTALKEQSKARAIAFALSANAFSLILGGWILTRLPI